MQISLLKRNNLIQIIHNYRVLSIKRIHHRRFINFHAFYPTRDIDFLLSVTAAVTLRRRDARQQNTSTPQNINELFKTNEQFLIINKNKIVIY